MVQGGTLLHGDCTGLQGSSQADGPYQGSINHAALAVGYNLGNCTNGVIDPSSCSDGYLIMKNSWGTGWGNQVGTAALL